MAECELDYCDHLPPESEYGPEAEFGPGDEYWHLYGDHVKFLRRYGHLIRYVRTYGPENFGEINLWWFPNLEIFTLAGHDYLTVSKEDIKYSGGKMDTARLFELFDDWYKDFDESLMSEEKLAEVAGRKGVDRKYGVYVELDLEVKDVGHYVSVLEHHSSAELVTCTTSDLTWTRKRYTRITAGRSPLLRTLSREGMRQWVAVRAQECFEEALRPWDLDQRTYWGVLTGIGHEFSRNCIPPFSQRMDSCGLSSQIVKLWDSWFLQHQGNLR